MREKDPTMQSNEIRFDFDVTGQARVLRLRGEVFGSLRFLIGNPDGLQYGHVTATDPKPFRQLAVQLQEVAKQLEAEQACGPEWKGLPPRDQEQ